MMTPAPDGCHVPIPSMVAEIGPGASDVSSVSHVSPRSGDRCFVNVNTAAGRPDRHQAQTVPSETLPRRVVEPVDGLGQPFQLLMTGTRGRLLDRDAVGDCSHRAEPRGRTVGALRPVPHSREAEAQDN